MKKSNIYNVLVTVVIAPLWVALLTDFLKDRPLLRIIAIAISSLLMLIAAFIVIHELHKKFDSWFKFQCWIVDGIANRARKKLARIIGKTNNPSVREYALNKLGEISPPKTCYGILSDLAEKERRSVVKEILQMQMKQIGGKI